GKCRRNRGFDRGGAFLDRSAQWVDVADGTSTHGGCKRRIVSALVWTPIGPTGPGDWYHHLGRACDDTRTGAGGRVRGVLRLLQAGRGPKHDDRCHSL